MRIFWQDVRYGIRILIKSPAFSIFAILMLAIGIGVNTAFFTLVDSFVLRPLPVEKPSQLAILHFQQEDGHFTPGLSYPDFLDVKEQTKQSFSDVLGYAIGLDALSRNGQADRILTNYVTGNYFSLLGVKAALGRLILPSEGSVRGADPVVVLGYSYWKTHFAGDPDVVGKTVLIDGHEMMVIGVAPQSFHGLLPPLDTQAYLPIGMTSIGSFPSEFLTSRRMRYFSVVGRLNSNVSVKDAQINLDVVANRLATTYPKDNKGTSFHVYPEPEARVGPPPNRAVELSRLFFSLAIMVLVLAGLNLVNLLLVRATGREREMGIRSALGSSRLRLTRQLTTESVVLALIGAVIGTPLGLWAGNLMNSIDFFGYGDAPTYQASSLDWRVLLFSLVAASLTGVLVAIAPAWRLSRTSLSLILHQGARGSSGERQRARSALVILQVAGSLTLLIVAGLFTRSLRNAQQTDLGFDPEHVINFNMDAHQIGYDETQGRKSYEEILRRVHDLPGISSASFACCGPLNELADLSRSLQIEGYIPPSGQSAPTVSYNIVTPDFFTTLKVPILNGRPFAETDDEHAPKVAIISQEMASRYWPGVDPVGRRFQFTEDPQHPIQVVGVAKDGKYSSTFEPKRPYFYVPLKQNYFSVVSLLVRSNTAPETAISEIRNEIAAVAPGLPTFGAETKIHQLEGTSGFLLFRLGALFGAGLGAVGLVLAIAGLYGVISYDAVQRTREIGIRMALGAQPGDILRLIIRRGVMILCAGLAVGLVLCFITTRFLARFLVGLSTADPLTFILITALLALVALLACLIPAYKSIRVDPTVALRYD